MQVGFQFSLDPPVKVQEVGVKFRLHQKSMSICWNCDHTDKGGEKKKEDPRDGSNGQSNKWTQETSPMCSISTWSYAALVGDLEHDFWEGFRN